MADFPNYTERFAVLRHDGDFLGRMKPAALLRYAQQIATDQCNRIGLDDAYYRRTHTAYLLAKQAMEIVRVPHVDEILSYETIPERSKHACNKRLTVVRDEAGREVACVDSRWVLVDTESRKIIRRPALVLEERWGEDIPRALDQRIPKPEQLEPAGTRKAEYSLCDINGHLNNTSYMDIVCDLIPQKMLAEREVRRVAISYHREVPMGESVALQRGLLSGSENGLYVLGVREDLPAFEAFCGFEP